MRIGWDRCDREHHRLSVPIAASRPLLAAMPTATVRPIGLKPEAGVAEPLVQAVQGEVCMPREQHTVR